MTEHKYAAEAAPNVPSFLSPDLLNPKQVSDMTGHPVTVLAQYRSRRTKGRDALGPEFVKIGREVFYTKAAVEAYVANRRG
ncbi:hypothetical protein [Jannaschia rubra]|uniref:Helix-turn-helix domain protein n=1 Tax=Jannaschia rubra TaxID=282197 RepID=A0A0M6XS06_9RHOB|nr:hypothetical protein [Jannaschia rubra]CTQ33919.1 hypothetical protein JAN5088_02708 [Jannaschia rubra]SFG76209.1 hypothetical protein SAMN04488517_11421 [Jannaschia rubra]